MKAVYAGTFDPLTLGHWWMIEEGTILFDELVVAVGVNVSKTPMFTGPERVSMIEETVRSRMSLSSHRLSVTQFTNQYLVEYAQEVGAKYILRGIRNPQDFHNEQVMRNINRDLAPSVETVFLMPPRDIAEVSSSMVKSLMGPKGWKNVIASYVSEPVLRRLIEWQERMVDNRL